MRFELVTAPNAEPIYLDEAKLHARITEAVQDALINRYIRAARFEAQEQTRQQMLHAKYVLRLDAFPSSWCVRPQWVAGGAIALPHVPVSDVVSVQYVDGVGVAQTIDAANYSIDRSRRPNLIVPTYSYTWPWPRYQPNAVTVTYVAGYQSKFTADATADTATVAGPKTWAVNDVVRVFNSGGALPAPLAADTDYYIKTAASGVYQLAATLGGALIDLTTAGTGLNFIGAAIPDVLIEWMLLRIAAMYEGREDAVLDDGRSGYVILPFAENLLDSVRMGWFPRPND